MAEGKSTRKSSRTAVKIQNVEAEGEETMQASRRLIRSLFQAGRNLAMIPVRLLPGESQKHMENAGREFTRGVAAITRELADGIERLARESNAND